MALPCELSCERVTALHDRMLAAGPAACARAMQEPGLAARTAGAMGAWYWVHRNHLCNTLLWDEEDRARRTDVPDAEIARCKRAIDRLNQQRNDAVEAIDRCVLDSLGVAPKLDARLHSETVGAMVDRLSILSLKAHHMQAQARRIEAGIGHVQACSIKVERLHLQRGDLCACLDRLLHELQAGTSWYRLYHQFKMYNDPTLNPWLYGSRAGAGAGAGA